MRAPNPAFEPQVEALGARYALGWWVRKRADGAAVVDHEGSVAGYQSLLLLVPEERLALAVLTNSWRGNGLVRRVVERLGLLPSADRVHVAGDAVPGDVAGTYALDGTEAEVQPRGGGLAVTETEADPVTGARRSTRYPAGPLGGGVYAFAGGLLMSHRLDFPRPGFARIGWVVMPRVGA
jgi:CubicO group peptidase (beta-lactamase class C family)